MAQIQAAELEAEQEEVGGEKTGGARKSKSRRRRGPTVNKKQRNPAVTNVVTTGVEVEKAKGQLKNAVIK